jgi:hypothetical protein
MPSTFTPNTGIEKPGSGEQSGTWGTTVNTNMDIVDRALNGVLSLALTGTTTNLQTTDATLSDGMYRYIKFTGSLSAAHTVTILPSDAQKIYYLEDATTGGQVITVEQGSGTFDMTVGGSHIIYADGNGTVDEIVVGTAFTVTNTGTGYGTLSYDSATGTLDFDKVTDANVRSAITGSGDISFDQSTGIISYTGSSGLSAGYGLEFNSVNTDTLDISSDMRVCSLVGFRDQSRGGSGSTNNYIKFNVGDVIRFYPANSEKASLNSSGDFSAQGDVTAYSDERMKTDITDIENALDIVKKMRGVNFTKIENDRRGTGVIAQEMQEVVPEVVHENDDGYLSVAYGNLVGVLIEAIKELSDEVAELKKGK